MAAMAPRAIITMLRAERRTGEVAGLRVLRRSHQRDDRADGEGAAEGEHQPRQEVVAEGVDAGVLALAEDHGAGS